MSQRVVTKDIKTPAEPWPCRVHGEVLVTCKHNNGSFHLPAFASQFPLKGARDDLATKPANHAPHRGITMHHTARQRRPLSPPPPKQIRLGPLLQPRKGLVRRVNVHAEQTRFLDKLVQLALGANLDAARLGGLGEAAR